MSSTDTNQPAYLATHPMNGNIEFRNAPNFDTTTDWSQVPESLHSLVDYARLFESHPSIVMSRLNETERNKLKIAVDAKWQELTDWLDESVRQGPPYPEGHTAFSSLRMAIEMMSM